MPKIIVTGGAGFIGSHQVDELVKNGFEVVVIDNLYEGKKENINEKAKFIEMDIRDSALLGIFEKEKPDFVFHFAAQMSVNFSVLNPIFDADVNILGSINVFEGCVKTGVKKIIFSSTGGAIYGDPEKIPTDENHPLAPRSPYGIAKLSIEQYLRFYHEHFGLKYGIVRYANVYGPRQTAHGEAGVIAIFTPLMLKGKKPKIFGDGLQTRDYIYIDDVISANMKVLASEEVGIYNVSTCRETSVMELFQLIKESLNSEILPEFSDGFPGQKACCLSNKKIKIALGWEPEMNLEEGIDKTVEWYKSQTL